MREGEDSANHAHAKKANHGDVHGFDGAQDEFVLAQEQQDEAAADAGKNHGADGQSITQHDEPPSFGGSGWGSAGDPEGHDSTQGEHRHPTRLELIDLSPYTPYRCQNEAEEKGPQQDGLVLEEPKDETRQAQYAGADAGNQYEQEIAIDVLPKTSEISL